MANRWGKVETVTDFFLSSKITEDGDCSHEIKRCLLLGRKSYDQSRQLTKKQRYHFTNKGPYSQSSGFLVVMYGCESWTIKKAEHRRIDAFKLWCWRRFLTVPWTSRRSNQSILKEINPEYSLEGLMLKLQYFGHLMWKADSLKKILMLGKIEGKRRSRWQRMRWLMASPSQWTWVWANSGRQRTEKPGMLQFIGPQRVRCDLATEQQQQTA